MAVTYLEKEMRKDNYTEKNFNSETEKRISNFKSTIF